MTIQTTVLSPVFMHTQNIAKPLETLSEKDLGLQLWDRAEYAQAKTRFSAMLASEQVDNFSLIHIADLLLAKKENPAFIIPFLEKAYYQGCHDAKVLYPLSLAYLDKLEESPQLVRQNMVIAKNYLLELLAYSPEHFETKKQLLNIYSHHLFPDKTEASDFAFKLIENKETYHWGHELLLNLTINKNTRNKKSEIKLKDGFKSISRQIKCRILEHFVYFIKTYPQDKKTQKALYACMQDKDIAAEQEQLVKKLKDWSII